MKTIAVLGATGAVGQVFLQLLQDREFPAESVRLFATQNSAGRTVEFRGQTLTVEPIELADFTGVELVLASMPADAARTYHPRAAAAGAIVIDNSSAFRMEPDVPLVVPEVNLHHLANIPRNIIANPNCSTIQMVVALKPIAEAFGLRRVVVSTYQSVSGAGDPGVQELLGQTRALMSNAKSHDPQVFPYSIAFNCIPQIGDFVEDGSTEEELKMVNETRKILDLASLSVVATCVRVPVLYSHSESIFIETEKPITTEAARETWSKAPGVELVHDPQRSVYPMPAPAYKRDEVYVGRIRTVPDDPRMLTFWCVSDNLRKGAALNAIQIAEELVARSKLSR